MASQQNPGLGLPCLAFHRCDRSTTLISVPEHERVVAGGAHDEVLRNKTICPTAQGLLLVRDPDTMRTFLWNPANSDTIPLPPLRGVDDFVLMDSHCLLSDQPAAPGCVVLLVEAHEDTFMWYCRPGGDGDEWAKYEYDIGSHVLPYQDEEDEDEDEDDEYEDEEDEYEMNFICPIAACHGRFYFDGAEPTELHVIDFSGSSPEPALSVITIDDTAAADGRGGGMKFLVESDGELYAVRLIIDFDNWPGEGEFEICGASVHRMDFSKRQWRNVHDLGGRTFLLSRFYFGASLAGGEHGLLPDRVYFACSRTNTLQVFDVQEGTRQVHKIDDPPAVVHKAFWLLPTNH